MLVSNVHVGIEQTSLDCELSVNLSSCDEPINEVEGHVISHGETDVTVQIEHVEMFYGSNVVAELNDNCDDCREVFHIPDMMPTGHIFSHYSQIVQLYLFFLQSTRLLLKIIEDQ